MAAASSIPWTEGPGGLQPRGSQILNRQKHTAQYNVSFPSPFFPMLSLKRPFLFHGIFFNFFFFTLASIVHNFQIGYVFPPSHLRRQTTFSSHAAPPAGHF